MMLGTHPDAIPIELSSLKAAVLSIFFQKRYVLPPTSKQELAQVDQESELETPSQGQSLPAFQHPIIVPFKLRR